MKDIMGLMKQAKEMQEKMAGAQAEIADLNVEGRAGAGLVTITLTGEGNMTGVTIDPSILSGEEVEIVEDLIVAAYQDAKVKLDGLRQDKMKSAFGGLELPQGMKMPF